MKKTLKTTLLIALLLVIVSIPGKAQQNITRGEWSDNGSGVLTITIIHLGTQYKSNNGTGPFLVVLYLSTSDGTEEILDTNSTNRFSIVKSGCRLEAIAYTNNDTDMLMDTIDNNTLEGGCFYSFKQTNSDTIHIALNYGSTSFTWYIGAGYNPSNNNTNQNEAAIDTVITTYASTHGEFVSFMATNAVSQTPGPHVTFSVYPNPTSQYLNIENPDRHTFFVYSYLGQRMIETKEDQINIQSLANGNYLLVDGNGNSQPFAVKH